MLKEPLKMVIKQFRQFSQTKPRKYWLSEIFLLIVKQNFDPIRVAHTRNSNET